MPLSSFISPCNILAHSVIEAVTELHRITEVAFSHIKSIMAIISRIVVHYNMLYEILCSCGHFRAITWQFRAPLRSREQPYFVPTLNQV